MKEYWTSLASILGVFAFCQTILQTVFPPELRFASAKLLNKIFNCFSTYCYFEITEIDGVNTNELYNAVQLYLSSSVSITGNRLSLTRAVNSSAFTFGLANNDSIVDTFNGVNVELEEVIEMARMTPADISEVLIKNRRKKEKAVDELLEILKVRAERNAKNGDVRVKDDDDEEEEEEEQEKRALDSDSPKQESEIEDDCKEGLEEEEKIK
ncbi:hypothetical protein TSUD_204710 [Trifolium subterraneum]|uniref:AAA-type ATPase N-terminal domain-containing protein n=1 Tax=Trifolium subterraneum TaxID=3900 RepID=A0A2Z6P7Q7_TRISU|nr:hypothetical protein TSUD_204710 [Trifolium subterraneum]